MYTINTTLSIEANCKCNNTTFRGAKKNFVDKICLYSSCFLLLQRFLTLAWEY